MSRQTLAASLQAAARWGSPRWPPFRLRPAPFSCSHLYGGVVYGRTMEFAFRLASDASDSAAVAAPDRAGRQTGHVWAAKMAPRPRRFWRAGLADGMNEKGLAGGILYFPDYAGYANPAKADPATAMAPWEFLTWALTSFATVAKVKDALKGVHIIDVVEPNLGVAPPLHYTLHDASGASIVIEPVKGELKVYDNPFGVMTNSPEFDWHLTNLRNYVKLSPVNAAPLAIDGQTIPRLGQGSGLLEIPAIRRRPRASSARSGLRYRPK